MSARSAVTARRSSSRDVAQIDVLQQPDLLDLWESWARHLRRLNRAPDTLRNYHEAIKQLDAYLAKMRMPRVAAHLTGEHIGEFITHLIKTKSPATADDRQRALNTFFNWLVDEGEMQVSPLYRVKSVKVPTKPVPVVQVDAIKKMLRACSGKSFEAKRDRALLLVLYDTGMRCGGLIGLRMDDIHLRDQVLFIRLKGGNTHIVRIEDRATEALDAYLRARKKHPKADLPNLWLTQWGGLTGRGCGFIIAALARKAGVEHVWPHRLRTQALTRRSRAVCQRARWYVRWAGAIAGCWTAMSQPWPMSWPAMTTKSTAPLTGCRRGPHGHTGNSRCGSSAACSSGVVGRAGVGGLG